MILLFIFKDLYDIITIEAAKRIAEKYNLTFVPLQAMFDNMPDCVRPDYWAGDGVHPTAAGHELISNEWIKAFNSL